MKNVADSVYVLRVRQMENGGRPKTIYTLKSADSQTVKHFATLAALFLFIEQAAAIQEAD